jgi:hypothetical protein
LIRFIPAPVPSSPVMTMAIGVAVVQPAAHAAALQVIELVGAVLSARAVKLVAEVRPALFVAVTDALPVVAVVPKL